MSFYRIKYYPLSRSRYLHIYIKRDRRGKGSPEKNALEIQKELATTEKAAENLLRARRTVRDIILCNTFDLFCTFTFNQEKVDRFNYKECKKKITNVFANYKKRYSPNFKYIIVPEFHKNGAVHFHGMVRGIRKEDLTVPEYIFKRDKGTGELMLVPNTRKYVDWSYYSKKLGFFSCSAVKHHDGCAHYVAKYIVKDLLAMNLGQRVFFASEGLERPEVIFDEDNVPLLEKPVIDNQYVSMLYSNTTLGILDEFWMERCSDLSDLPDFTKKENVLFPRMTGTQLALFMK